MKWNLKIALLSIVVASGLAQTYCKPTKDDNNAICTKACYPNPVDRVYGKQCFCKADIVIREMPNEEVSGNR